MFNINNPRGYAKGRTFENRLGYNLNNYKELQNEIVRRATKYPSYLKGNNGYGAKYDQKIVLYGKKGTPANVVVGRLLTLITQE